MTNDMFLAKSKELKSSYKEMVDKLESLQTQEPEEITKQRKQLYIELQQREQSLRQMNQAARSRVIADMAKLQVDYYKQMEEIIHHDIEQMSEETSDEQKIESTSLLAEYAIDLAKDAMIQAIYTTYLAAEQQLQQK